MQLDYLDQELFQFTHLREVRHHPLDTHLALYMNFNSRTYVRCDLAELDDLTENVKFQFTHLREVRLDWPG